MNRTKIEWVKNPDGSQGYTWNPITGCLKGCSYCYARRLANGRLKQRYIANKNVAPAEPLPNGGYRTPVNIRADLTLLEAHQAKPFYPRFWEDRLFQPFNDKYISQKGIFVCDMSDLFGIGIPIEWTKAVMDVIEDCPQDRFYLLTKQPQNLAKFSPFPPNCWVGVTATNTEMLMQACSYLEYPLQAKVKYISIEPFLEWDYNWTSSYLVNCLERAKIGWLIIGAQTKPTVYPKIEWVQEILVAAHNTNIPVFIKNNLQLLLAKEWPTWKLRQELPSQPKEICPDTKEEDGLRRLIS